MPNKKRSSEFSQMCTTDLFVDLAFREKKITSAAYRRYYDREWLHQRWSYEERMIAWRRWEQWARLKSHPAPNNSTLAKKTSEPLPPSPILSSQASSLR